MKYNFDYSEFKNVSQDAIDLIKQILVVLEKRPSEAEKRYLYFFVVVYKEKLYFSNLLYSSNLKTILTKN